jgi:hypothetical protein
MPLHASRLVFCLLSLGTAAAGATGIAVQVQDAAGKPAA